MTDIEQWRADVLGILQGLDLPLQVLMVLAAFSLGLFSVRAIA